MKSPYLKKTVVCLLAAALVAGAASSGAQDAYVPWSLRDHYTFPGKPASLHYAVKTAEWQVEVEGLGRFVGDMQAEIELTNGEVIVVSALESDGDSRDSFSTALGSGASFGSMFQPRRGLRARFTVASYGRRPFVTMVLSVVATGDEVIEISALRSTLTGSRGIAGAGLRVLQSAAVSQGSGDIPADTGRANLVRFAGTSPRVTVALGVLPHGTGESYVQFEESGGEWRGAVVSKFDPPVRLSRGETLESAPLWVSFATPDPAEVKRLFDWSLSAVSASSGVAEVAATSTSQEAPENR